MSLPASDPDHPGGPGVGFLEHLGELADRIGVSVPTLVGGAVAACVAGFIAYQSFLGPRDAAPELSIPYAVTTSVAPAPPLPATSDLVEELTVHAAGAVRHPGVYVLGSGARVSDLLAAAGGPAPGADLDRVNLAAPVADGARVYVPLVGQDSPPPVVAGGSPQIEGSAGGVDPGQTIDVNRASASELQSLPGIGPATSAAIVEHRERNGPFASVDDLLDVSGIGEAKLAALRDLVHAG